MRTLDEGGLDRPETVLVPGVWESHPTLVNYRGRAFFEQRIICSGNVRIWFGGVSFQAEVFLDGESLVVSRYTGRRIAGEEDGGNIIPGRGKQTSNCQ